STPWSHGYAATVDANVAKVAADGQGNVVVAGLLMGTTDFGAGSVTGAAASFVAKFGPNGDLLWSKVFDSASALSGPHIAGLAFDAQGDLVLTGDFDGITDFGGGALTAQGRDVFVAKLDASGAHVWSKRFGGPTDYDSAIGAAIDGSGNVIVMGDYSGS